MTLIFNTNSIQPTESSGGGGGTDSFTSYFGGNVYHLLDCVDSDGLIPFFTVNQTEMVFTDVISIPTGWVNYKFKNSSVTSVSFPNLTSVKGYQSGQRMFDSCPLLTSVYFPELTEVVGYSTPSQMFYNCSSLTSVAFPKLSKLQGAFAFTGVFSSCSSLEDVYFNALTTGSFTDNNAFTNLLTTSGTSVTHTLHFPSNLETTIQSLSGYPNFGGTSDYVTLAFDLPATS